ncbi:hypothetical protein [Microbacterium sp.]|uniref:hypothetical protein n=1 Tax=Microbacterium sp. TaxID=51671 RepID=UPI003F9B8210
MPPDPRDTSTELRMLRAKAYGPGGGLTGEELARLEQLEGRTAEPDPEAPGRPLSERSETKRAERAQRVEAFPEADPSTGSGSGDTDSGSGKRPRRWPILLVAAAALLAIGVGVGWGVWGWDAEASALASAHADTQAELEAERTFDPGTVVPLAADHGVVVWSASRAEGDEVCVIVTVPPRIPQTDCVTRERVDNYAWPSAMVMVPEGEEKAGQQLSASLIPQANGDIVPFIQVWGESSSWELQYSENELAQLRAVEAIGYRGEMLQALGADGDRIVWASWESGTLCVVAPTGRDGFAEACADGANEDLVLGTEVDGIPTRYIVTQSEMRSPQLTIYKDVDTEYYFGTDDLSSIDDKTGE